jgi:hypothetical protein
LSESADPVLQTVAPEPAVLLEDLGVAEFVDDARTF